jgi:hypothetical protein
MFLDLQSTNEEEGEAKEQNQKLLTQESCWQLTKERCGQMAAVYSEYTRKLLTASKIKLWTDDSCL